MNEIRRYITILENASQAELQKYRDEVKYWKNEHKKYWPVSPELLAQYNDGSHTKKDSDGDLIWYQNGQRHRDGDKPAKIWPDGTLEWWKNGKLHRDGDKPAVISANGSLAWYQNNQLHRDNDKPAYIGRYGSLIWYQNNQLHKFSGPAAITSDGKLKWYWRGQHIPVNSQEEFVEYLTSHNLIEMKPKTITASDAYAIYEEAVKKKNLMLLNLWEETYAPKLDKMIREQAELGYTSVSLEYATWMPMVYFIRDLGYEVTCYPETPSELEVSWNKE